ncbi:MAG: hypothetical protein QGH60_00650 [Phycisphaerae bacterium]|nr:hypothetical protein [Phycisphaerae bacterium]
MFEREKFTDAAKDLHRYVTLNPGDEYGALWRYIARRRAGQSLADKELTDYMSKHVKDRSVWPGAVFEMFAGRIDPAKCLKSAEPTKPDLTGAKLSPADKISRQTAYEKLRRRQLCGAYFYVAQYEMIRGRKDAARKLFRKCLATNVTIYDVYRCAKVTLRRMETKR